MSSSRTSAVTEPHFKEVVLQGLGWELVELTAVLKAHGFEVSEWLCRGNYFSIKGRYARARDGDHSSLAALRQTDRTGSDVEWTGWSIPTTRDVSRLVVERLSRSVAQSCPPFIALLRALFETPDACRQSADTFASRAGICRRTLDRYVIRSGIRSTRLLFVGARTCYAFSDLKNQSKTRVRLSQDLGCASFRSLQRQCNSLTGFDIINLVKNLTEREFAELLVASLFRG